jgi:hypothetical protein
LKRGEIKSENLELKCPDIDVTIHRKAMAPFKTQMV